MKKPRFVRPSWIDLQVDGRNSDIGIGPKRKAGEMSGQLYVRHKGQITPSISFKTYVNGNTSKVFVYDANGKVIYIHETELD